MINRTFILPNSETTTDVDVYVDSWKSLAKRITDITNWKAISFCPDVQFLKPNGNTISLTIDEIEALTSYNK